MSDHIGLTVSQSSMPNTDVRTSREVYLVSLNSTVSTDPVPLFTSTPKDAGSFLWLDAETIAYLNQSTLYSLSVDYSTEHVEEKKGGLDAKEVLTFPEGVNPSGLKYDSSSGYLVFSGQVWGHHDFEETAKEDKKWEERKDTGVVFDELFIR